MYKYLFVTVSFLFFSIVAMAGSIKDFGGNSLSSKCQDDIPAAIQTLKNAGITVFSIGNGKWEMVGNGKVKILNDDGSVFGEFTNVVSYSQNRMVVTKGTYTVKPTEVFLGWYYDSSNIPIPVKKTLGNVKEEYTIVTDWDIIDNNGKSILKFPIYDANIFQEGLCAVRVSDKYGFIDLDGNLVCEPKFDYAYRFFGEYGIIEDKYRNHVGIINKKFEILLPVSKELCDVRNFVPEYKGCKGLSLGTKKGIFYEVKTLLEYYTKNGNNLKKALKEYDNKYRK